MFPLHFAHFVRSLSLCCGAAMSIHLADGPKSLTCGGNNYPVLELNMGCRKCRSDNNSKICNKKFVAGPHGHNTVVICWGIKSSRKWVQLWQYRLDKNEVAKLFANCEIFFGRSKRTFFSSCLYASTEKSTEWADKLTRAQLHRGGCLPYFPHGHTPILLSLLAGRHEPH